MVFMYNLCCFFAGNTSFITRSCMQTLLQHRSRLCHSLPTSSESIRYTCLISAYCITLYSLWAFILRQRKIDVIKSWILLHHSKDLLASILHCVANIPISLNAVSIVELNWTLTCRNPQYIRSRKQLLPLYFLLVGVRWLAGVSCVTPVWRSMGE